MNSKSIISSTNNPQIKNLALLQRKSKARREQGLFIVEGIKMLRRLRPQDYWLRPICLKASVRKDNDRGILHRAGI